jgi:predicted O-linked N-acetylglucosamine transferase (SPINDLY family)
VKAVEEYVQRIAPGSDLDLMLSPENLFFWQCHLAQRRCDWTSWDVCVTEMRRLASASDAAVEPAVAFMAFHLPLSGEERHAIARHIAAGFEASTPALSAPMVQRAARIRVGVLSPDLREHLNAHLLLPLFELLDRKRFTLYAYSLAVDDGSEIRDKLGVATNHFRDLHATTDHDAAARIREDGIDILVDAGGHTTGARFGITARRPALLQVLYLGFAGSLGSKRVDYAIVDHVVGSNPSEWTEQLVRLPSTYYLYDFRDLTPSEPVTRKDYGLPEGGFVYCAFHKAEKITPDAFDLWLQILRETPDSVLWLLDLPPIAQSKLRRRAAAAGVAGERLFFAPFDPRERYLARQRLGDLFLDAIHHNAMTTACDALGAGLPLLTTRGSTMSSRAAESLLRAAGMPELVSADHNAFVRSAVQLAQPAAIASTKEKLARNRQSAPLFDTAARVRELELAFVGMFEHAMRGEPPRGFDV